MSNKIYELSDSEFVELIKSSHNVREVLFKLDLTTVGNSWGYSLVKRRMKELQLCGSDFVGKSAMKVLKNPKIVSTDTILIENSKTSRCVVRRHILENNLLEYKCAVCGINTWDNKPLSLELDHINGNNNDHRLKNLRFLCPNCHSQTRTYGSKNSVKMVLSRFHLTNDDIEKIVDAYNQYTNMEKVAEVTGYKLGAVRQVIQDKRISVNAKNQKFVIRYDLEGNELGRWGSINECCAFLIKNKELKTENVKTARNTFLRNRSKDVWLNSKWELIDAY